MFDSGVVKLKIDDAKVFSFFIILIVTESVFSVFEFKEPLSASYDSMTN